MLTLGGYLFSYFDARWLDLLLPVIFSRWRSIVRKRKPEARMPVDIYALNYPSNKNPWHSGSA